MISWTSCPNASEAIRWFAVQDGTGPWHQVVGSNGVFTFQVDSERAGVAYTSVGDYSSATTHVRFYTAAELQGVVPPCFSRRAPGFGKNVNGTVASAEGSVDAEIALMGVGASASGAFWDGHQPWSFTLSDVGSGDADLLAVSDFSCQADDRCLVATNMIIRRDIDAPAGSTLPVLDFADPRESFQLMRKSLTLRGVASGEVVSIDEVFSTVKTSYMLTLMTRPRMTATGPTIELDYPGVPNDHLAAGDVHRFLILARSTNAFREALVAFHNASDQSATLGPTLPAVAISTTRFNGSVSISAKLAGDGDFNTWFGEFSQATADILVRISRGYARAGDVSLDVPDFGHVPGWSTTWGLQSGIEARWDVSATNLDALTVESVRPFGSLPPYQASSRYGRVTP
jgi:hypothetical protein